MNRKLRILGLAALALALAVSGAWAADVTVDGGTATWENATGFSAGSNVTGDGVATDNTSVVTLKNGAVVTATTTSGLAAKELILEDSTLNLTGTGLLTLKDGANAGKIEVSGDSKIVLDGNQAGLLTLGSNSTLKIHAGVKLEVLYKNDGNTATISGAATTLALQGPGKLVLGVKVDNNINPLKGDDGVTLEFAPGGVFSLLAQDVTFDKGSIVVPNTVKNDVFPAMNGKGVTLKDGNLTIDAGGVFGETAVGGINKLVLESGDLKLNATDALSKNVKNIELKDKATAEINKIGAIQAEGAEVLKDEFSVPRGAYYGPKPAKINDNVAVAMDAFEKGTTTVKVKKGGVLKVNARQLLKKVEKDVDAGKVVIAKDAVLYVGDDTAVVDVDVDVDHSSIIANVKDGVLCDDDLTGVDILLHFLQELARVDLEDAALLHLDGRRSLLKSIHRHGDIIINLSGLRAVVGPSRHRKFILEDLGPLGLDRADFVDLRRGLILQLDIFDILTQRVRSVQLQVAGLQHQLIDPTDGRLPEDAARVDREVPILERHTLAIHRREHIVLDRVRNHDAALVEGHILGQQRKYSAGRELQGNAVVPLQRIDVVIHLDSQDELSRSLQRQSCSSARNRSGITVVLVENLQLNASMDLQGAVAPQGQEPRLVAIQNNLRIAANLDLACVGAILKGQ